MTKTGAAPRPATAAEWRYRQRALASALALAEEGGPDQTLEVMVRGAAPVPLALAGHLLIPALTAALAEAGEELARASDGDTSRAGDKGSAGGSVGAGELPDAR